ncbi:helix-turn-helix domain-containing protein [Kutzneria buriramensis]|uniref:winged helix-turn-helix transcriptional regulator n=1 Tax=Kutzneria buriramensis TaxID=1045776 RepID=UPI000E2242C7|nr:winged helix-turn-helix transcriptional regulator [Kutzneria buriramensis]
MTSTVTTSHPPREREEHSDSAAGCDEDRADVPHEHGAALLQSLLDLRQLLAGEWNADILVVLQAGPRRYTELLEAVRTSTAVDRRTGRCRHAQTRTFVYTLRRMEADGLITRREQESVWPRQVLYSLTPTASQLLSSLTAHLGSPRRATS